MWLSVDPQADKYPANTPYLYCNGNPIMMIDPDGREWFLNDESQIIWQDNPANAPRNYTYIGTSGNLLAYYGLSAQYGEQDVMNFRVGTNITSK